MLRSLRSLLLSVPVLLAAVPPALAADDPHYVVQVQPAEKLLKTAKEFAARFAAPQLGEEAREKTSSEIDAQLVKVLGKGWREAIDESKPILIYGRLTNESKENMPVLLLPVKSEKAAREHLKERGIQVEDSENGCQKGTLPGMKEPVYFRFAHNYMYATQGATEPLAEERLLAPAKLVDARDKAAVVARLYIDRLPADFVDSYEKGFHEGFEQGVQKSTGGSLPGPASEAVKKWQKSLEAQNSAIVRQGKTLSLRLDLDPASGVLRTNLRLRPKPDSDLAKMLSAIRMGPSLGAALVGSEPLAAVQARLSLPDEVSSYLLKQLRRSIQDALAQVEDEKAQGAFKDMATALEPTVEQGILDTALVMHGPGKQKRYGAVLSLQLKNGLAVEKAARKVIGFLPANSPLGLLRIDVDTIGETKVHRYPLGEVVPPPVRQLFGKGTAVIAFREEGVLVAYGEGAEEQLGKALAAPLGKAPPLLLHAEGDTRGLADLIVQNDPGSAKYMKALAEGLGDRLHLVHLSLEGGEALEMKLALNVLLMPRAASSQKAPAAPRPPAVEPTPPPKPCP